MIAEEGEETHRFLAMITKEVISAMIHNSTFKVEKLKIPLSSKQARTSISLCMSKEQELFPISGFPRNLGTDGLQNGKVRKADDFVAKQPLSPAIEKEISTHARDGQGRQTSTNRSSLNVSIQRSSSSETLPVHFAEEDILFWTRAFQRSWPNTREISKENSTTSTSHAETISEISSESPIDSPVGVESKQPEEVPLPETPAGELNHYERLSDHRPRIGDSQMRSHSRLGLPSRSKQSPRDASPTPQANSRNKVKPRRLSWEESRSHLTLKPEVLPPLRTATSLAPTGNLDIFNDHVPQLDNDDREPQQLSVGERVELWSQKGLMKPHVPARKATWPPKISVQTNIPSNPMSQSATAPSFFRDMPYTRRQEERSSPISPTILYSASSHNTPKSPASGKKDLPPVPYIASDEEGFKIPRMRSMVYQAAVGQK
ncbi:uncharacterized protein PAC_10166 [Phialocephala subalpina]|uniref:Uncharacterized protein n=1 Tax=Phialocephala subalpina TaxID=576137 RepID=A0A1L7X5G7_9HELO|nr:uncharacterized protein PAC_10166 [Phialocephala subalpina]